jgi:predicted DNA-binding protein (UPF0251 family)
MMEQGRGIREEGREMFLVKKPVARAVMVQSVREGSTGQVVCIAPERVTLHRVWAVAEVETVGPPNPAEPKVELAFYRKYTEALLRRYLRLSTQAGRIPSLMSRDVFRGNVSHYTVRGFEEVVIFCHDVEQRLAKLEPLQQQVIKRVALQRYTQGEAAGMLGISPRTCWTQYGQALDHLTSMLLEVGLLDLSHR